MEEIPAWHAAGDYARVHASLACTGDLGARRCRPAGRQPSETVSMRGDGSCIPGGQATRVGKPEPVARPPGQSTQFVRGTRRKIRLRPRWIAVLPSQGMRSSIHKMVEFETSHPRMVFRKGTGVPAMVGSWGARRARAEQILAAIARARLGPCRRSRPTVAPKQMRSLVLRGCRDGASRGRTRLRIRDRSTRFSHPPWTMRLDRSVSARARRARGRELPARWGVSPSETTVTARRSVV